VATDHDFQKQILRKKIGQTIRLTVWRRGATLKIAVATAELPGELTRVANVQAPKLKAATAEALGLQLRDPDAAAGAMVSAIAPESAASRAEIVAGDIITAVETKPVATAEACARAIAASARERGEKGVLLNIERKGRRTFAVLKAVQ
jgi:S1-C subfamily serine protease